MITHTTDGFARLVAHCHRFDLATLETFLMRGRVFAIAVRTDGFAGLPIFVNSCLLLADIANTLHGLTSFWFWVGLEKSKFRSPDLTTYPTVLKVVCQSKKENRNSCEFLEQKTYFLARRISEISEARAGKANR